MSDIDLIGAYFKTVQTGDSAKPGALVAANVVWHQPAQNQFIGTHEGADAVFAMRVS